MEKDRICAVKHDCEGDCKNDLYFVSGFTDEWDVNFYLPKWEWGDRRVLECNLKLAENEHDLDKVIDRLREGILESSGNKKVDVVGLSLGTQYAVRYASKNLEKVNKLVLLSGGEKLRPYVGWGLKAFSRALSIVKLPTVSDKSVDNLVKIDVSEDAKNLEVDTLAYQCEGDALIADKLLDNIPNSKYFFDRSGLHWFCLHRNWVNNDVLQFLNE